MMIFQITAFCIVSIYFFHWFVRGNNPLSNILKFTAISVASWIVEETSIRAYHFYQYSSDWNLFLGNVPLLVILIWPLVIHSGWELASQLMSGNKRHARLIAALIIWIDASLIEVISVKIGFWSWNAPGIFEVPLIGIFGWVYFSFLSILILKFKMDRKSGAVKFIYILIFTVFGTHVLIIASWWLFFRWMLFPLNMAYITPVAWIISILFIYVIQRKSLDANVDSKILILRFLPSVLFFIWYLKGDPDVLHTAYIIAFSFPYIFIAYKISKGKVCHKSYKESLGLK